MEYKKRLIESQLKDAVHMAQWIDASPHEWPKGLADIALLCHGYLDLQQRIAQLESELAEARQGNEELDGTDAAHPAWWRGNDAGVAQVCAKINAILEGADVFGTAAEPWESTQRRVAEARKDSERLAWAWANPDKFAEAQRSTPPNRTGRQQIDAARGTK